MAVFDSNSEDKAKAALKSWKSDPARMVRELWGVEPDAWQLDVLSAFPTTQRIAMKACKGPGKTCLLAWLCWNFLLTRPFPNIAATSINKDNLRDNLWKEMAKWQERSPILKELFEWGATRISARRHPSQWWMSARAWSKSADAQQQADTLSGLHGDFIMFVLDESGGIPDSVMAAAEGVLANDLGPGQEAHILQAGNPTHLSGPLYRATTSGRAHWYVVEISADPDDPKRTPRVSADWARSQIAQYGRDNPWVLVNIFGQFPPGSMNALIGVDEVEAAERRGYQEHDISASPRILGIDVARYGDDASVIFPRQGLQAFTPIMYRNLNSIQGASVVARKVDDWHSDAEFVDDTGGFGAGWIDQLQNLKYSPIGVGFGTAASRPTEYENKRAEMAFDAVAWIKKGGALPVCPELRRALTETTYMFSKNSSRMILEPKNQVKIKLGFSPDHFDAFILTFAHPVQKRVNTEQRTSARKNRSATAEYDMFHDLGHGGRGDTAIRDQVYDALLR